MGVAKILFGTVADDGGMGTDLNIAGYTLQDSCEVTPDDPETQEFYAEEVDNPVITKTKKGKINFKCSIMNPEIATLKQFLGGEVSEDGKTWGDGDTYEDIEMSIRIVPDQGAAAIDLPRVKINAKFNMPLNNSSLVTLDVAGLVLQPEKEGVRRMYVHKELPNADSTL